MSNHLNILIYRFLKDHRESDSGWAKITPTDMSLLRKIIRELIELKCDRDADGDLPIEFILVNLRTHEPMHFEPIPFRVQRNDDNEMIEEIPFEQMMRVLMLNLGIAHNRLDTEFRIQQHHELEK